MGNTSDSNLWLIEIGENDQYWATCLERVPNMICIAYRHLRTLANEYSGAAEPPFRCGVSHLSGMS